MRTPPWLIVLLVLVILGVGVYGYFTTPLPFGLNSFIRTPGGGGSAAAPGGPGGPAAVRTSAGQPLVLGTLNVVIQAAQRNQDLSARGGPVGSFTVLQLELQNGGSEPIIAQPTDFRLVDDAGRSYAVDLEATRSSSTVAKRRLLFESSVPPGGRVATILAFETPADVGALSLRVALGYGVVELPR